MPITTAGHDRRSAIAALWNNAVAISKTRAEKYLIEACGPALPPLPPSILRFHPKTPLRPEWKRCSDTSPAMLAPLTDETGAIVGLHLTYLHKHAVTHRKHFGQIIGGRIFLGPIGPKMIVADSVETALLAGAETGLASIATIVPRNLATFAPPKGVKLLLITHDPNNRRFKSAARKLSDRLWVSNIAQKSLHLPSQPLTRATL